MRVVQGWMGERRQLVGRLISNVIGIRRVLAISRAFVPRVVIVVIVDDIGSAPFGWVVRTACAADRRVLVPACHWGRHLTCSEGKRHRTKRATSQFGMGVAKRRQTRKVQTGLTANQGNLAE